MNAPHWPKLAVLVLGIVAIRVALRELGCPEAIATRVPQALALVPFVAVVARLAPGDPPRRAWALFAVANLLVLAAALAHAWSPAPPAVLARWILLVVANACGPIAMIVFARVLARTGLAVLGPIARATVAALALIAIAHAGIAIAHRVAEPWPATALDSLALWGCCFVAAADVVSFVAAVTAVALVHDMAGGAVARPYLLVAASSAIFLALDGAVAAAGIDDYGALAPLARLLPALAWALAAAGAYTQLELLRAARGTT